MNDVTASPQPNSATEKPDRYPWVWDYALTRREFDEILAGRNVDGPLDRDWAAVRVIEYASYPEMILRLGVGGLVAGWPRWRNRIRAIDQRRALDFVVRLISTRHPELLNDEGG